MRQLGFEQFLVAGHDRGGRCAYRMALDHPERVLKLAVLDIIPTGEALRRINPTFALDYWHWFFLAAPYPLPENLIAANPADFYFPNRDLFEPAALAEYLCAVRQPETIHAMCEDYRAAASLDYQFDEADRGQRKITCPLLVLWGRRGKLEQWYDVLRIWSDWADNVQGYAIDSGHFLAEESPQGTYAVLNDFFQQSVPHS